MPALKNEETENVVFGFWFFLFLIVCKGLCEAFTTISISIISIGVSNSVTSDMAGIAIGLTQAAVSLSRG